MKGWKIALIVISVVFVLAAVAVLLVWLGVFGRGLKVNMVVVGSKSQKRLTGGTAQDHSDLSIRELSYALTNISLAESATLVGTSFQNPEGVISANLQSTQLGNDTIHYPQAQDPQQPIEWLDLMNQAAVDRKLASVTLAPQGVKNFNPQYNFRFLSLQYYMPIKLNAVCQLPDGRFMATRQSDSLTHEVSTGASTGAHGESHETYAMKYDESFIQSGVTTLADVVSETATLVVPNGGTWLQLPTDGFKLDGASIANNRLVLIYDPYLNIRGWATEAGETTSAGRQGGTLTDKDGNEWVMPVLQNVPLLVPNGDAVLRDTYTIDQPDVKYTIMIVIYYLRSDPARIRAANTGVFRRGTEPWPSNAPSALPGVLELKQDGEDWSFWAVTEVAALDRTAWLTNFRQGASGRCKIYAIPVGTQTFGLVFSATGSWAPPLTETVITEVDYVRQTQGTLVHQ